MLVEIFEKDIQDYNHFVYLHPSGSFLQSWEWGDWQAALGRQVFRYWILDDKGNPTGSVQLIKMPLPFGKYYLYAPYGPLISNELKVESEKLLHELQQHFSAAMFIRIEPKDLQLVTGNSLPIIKSTNVQPAKTLVIDLSKSEDQLLGEMHHKTRYNIKLAQKHGVEVKGEFTVSVGHGLFFEEVLRLVMGTSGRQNFATFPESYYRKMADYFTLQPSGGIILHVYKAIFQNQLLATAFIVDFGGVRTFLFGGSSELHKNVMAPYLLHWQAMHDAKTLAFKSYDFWGIETSSGAVPGFVRFKLGFGGVEKNYAGAYDIINNRLAYKTYSLGRALNKFRKKISPK